MNNNIIIKGAKEHNLKNINCVVYRTDECGEIELSRILNLK